MKSQHKEKTMYLCNIILVLDLKNWIIGDFVVKYKCCECDF